MNEELSIELCHLTVGYSKKGVQLSQLHQQAITPIRGCTCLNCTSKTMKPSGWCS